MKLAIKAYIVTLLLLACGFAVSAQPRSEKDDRNTAPTVGTGGNVGGPTGLFTVYDGQTLRKGEYTFSIAYSNYDRDPGDADITTVPISFQIGVTNHLELFFTTEAWRGIKVNAPRNLSGFYLPNSQVFINGVLTRPPAIIIAGSGPFIGQAVYSPGGPFVQYPFYPTVVGIPHQGNGSAAGIFPGIGSPFGSILPGLVLSTRPIVGGTTPVTFTSAPSYLPDAPFINRTYGTSSFNSITGGVKWRMNSNSSAVGYGLKASWTWYLDHADSFSGFNMLQRGSGPGAKWGDINLTFFADARLSQHINLSGNVGYTHATNPKATFGGQDVTLLDRPDEFLASMAADFPVNKYLQFILELNSIKYVGGHTPNVFERDPVDGIIGLRVFPARWWGFGGAYRANLNQQGSRSFGDRPIPAGFIASTSPSGYIAQLWFGRRHPRVGPVVNLPANVESVALSATTIHLPCAPGTVPVSGTCDDNRTISVTTHAVDPENDVLTYSYTVSGGRIIGTGANVQWDLSTATPGTYTITTGVDDGCGICGRTNTQTITVTACDCRPACVCPTVSVSGPSGLTPINQPMTFVANVGGGENITYNWTVSAGTISSGQGTPTITVDTTGLAGGTNVTATVELGGTPAGCDCPKTASETASIEQPRAPTLVSEFGQKTPDEIKAELDPFIIQLNNDPTAQGYIINYGTPAQIKARRAVLVKAINFRKFPMERITFVDGPDTGDGPRTKLYIVPAGVTPPAP
jgi:hypothetical protein